MRILYFITSLGLGGAEVVTLDLANRFSNQGNEVAIVYLTGNNYLAEKISPNISVYSLGMSKNPLSFIKAIRKSAFFLKEFGPDIVHSHMIHANILMRILRLFVNFPVLICTEHSKNIGKYYRMLLYRLTDSLSDINTNVSLEATDYFISKKAFSSSKSKVVYNGIDLKNCIKTSDNFARKEFSISDDEFLFINVGRLTEAKNQELLIRAIAQNDNCKLIICGKGHLEKELSELITSLNLTDRVFLAGPRKDIANFYSTADSFILSSSWEGLPMVILESMSYGLPIITTNVGGAYETIPDKSWIIPPENFEKLVGAINRMVGMSKESRLEVSQKNIEAVRKFDIETIFLEWSSLYKDTLKSRILKSQKN